MLLTGDEHVTDVLRPEHDSAMEKHICALLERLEARGWDLKNKRLVRHDESA
jgi:hypothetical protein